MNAFVADEVDLQRDQFLRVNNAKPLPRGLITELLPEVSTILPDENGRQADSVGHLRLAQPDPASRPFAA